MGNSKSDSDKVSDSQPKRRIKTFRVRIGKLANNRPAFAVESEEQTPYGVRHLATVWVRSRLSAIGCRAFREVSYESPQDARYRKAFGLILFALEKRVRCNAPARIARRLMWR